MFFSWQFTSLMSLARRAYALDKAHPGKKRRNSIGMRTASQSRICMQFDEGLTHMHSS
jgi:hypothetical protein